jgi:hypothetical protein
MPIWPAVEPPVVSALILVCSAALSLVSGTIAAAGQGFPLGGVGAAHLIGEGADVDAHRVRHQRNLGIEAGVVNRPLGS